MIFNYIARDAIEVYMKNKPLKQVQHAKLLGITLDINLNWAHHIDQICNKLAYPSYIIKKNKNLLDKATLKMVYHAIFESHLLYGIGIWGPMIKNTNKMGRMTKIQKNIVSETKLENKVLTLEQLIDLNLGKISYRYINDLLPKRISNLFEPNQHSYNTQNSTAPVIKHHTNTLYNSSFMCKSPMIWLKLNDNIKSAKTQKGYSLRFKKCFL